MHGTDTKNAAKHTLRTPQALQDAGFVEVHDRAALDAVAARYAIAITPAVADTMGADATDPVARQYVPSAAELVSTDGESADPIGDHAHAPVDGIVHRYPDRVLLKLTHVCAVYCRFCFRREMVGPQNGEALSPAALDAAVAYIAAHPQIWEVILTGGDPLILSPRRLKDVAQRLAQIPHVKILRVHTRIPVAEPSRVTAPLIRALKASGKTIYVVVHVNHTQELSEEVCAALDRLSDAGIPLLSQSVLLRGVNDDAAVLGALMRRLVECRVKPYYIHHLDAAPGTGHFRTSIATGQEIMRMLHGRYSGLCQPRYVLDIPGGFGKSPIGPSYLQNACGGRPDESLVEDFQGRSHRVKSGV